MIQRLQDALFGHLVNLTGFAWYWPNRIETEPVAPYVRVLLLTNQSSRPWVPPRRGSIETGLLQLTLFTDLEQGIPLDDIDMIRAHFPDDLTLCHVGLTVIVRDPPSVTPSFRDGPHWLSPITIPYTAYED